MIQSYLVVTGKTVANKTVTIPDGILGLTVQNVGDTDATITFYDGNSVTLRAGGGVFSLDTILIPYRGVIIAATATTIDYIVIGVNATDITIA
jgi:hypothetical protein